MASLHWIFALTLALLCWINAQPVTRSTDERPYVFTIISRLENLTDDETAGLTLHSPTNVIEDNEHAALECIREQLDVVMKTPSLEEDVMDDIANLFNLLNHTCFDVKMPQNTSGSNSTSPCGTHKKVGFQQFLENIENLVQKLNSGQTTKNRC